MPSRYRSRQQALQMLYLADMRGQESDEAARAFYGSLASDEAEPSLPDAFADELVQGTLEHRIELDQMIARHSENWRLDRMAVVDRNLLRLAVFEMRHLNTPAAVVIDQALELAGKFSAPESISFINGVLDAIRRSTAQPPPSQP